MFVDLPEKEMTERNGDFMRIPNLLKKGDFIGFAAPSFGCNIEPYATAFKNAGKKLSEQGFLLDIGPNCYEGKGIGISNTPEKCAEEINAFFAKDGIKAVISCGGGELMCEILDYVDFEKIRMSEPKWFMGYSDNTNLTFLLTTLCDTASVYGPCAPAFGMEPWHPALQDTLDLLMGNRVEVSGYPLWEKESKKDGEHPLEPYHVTEERKIVSFQDGTYADGESTEIQIEGRLLGGCLDCLGVLAGTKFDKVAAFADRYKKDGIIWYMEACDLNVMGIRRTLWQLEHTGWFSHVKGFLFGRPLHFGEEMFGLDQYRAVTDVLSRYQVPIIMDLDIGHLPPMMPMVNGAYAKVRISGNDVRICYDL